MSHEIPIGDKERALRTLQARADEMKNAMLAAGIRGEVDEMLSIAPRFKDIRRQTLDAQRELNKDKIEAARRLIADVIAETVAGINYKELAGEDITSIMWDRKSDGQGRLLINGIRHPGANMVAARTGTPTHTRKKIGSRLREEHVREHGLDIQKGYFSKDGIAYQRPVEFPVALFDPDGYYIIRSEASMQSNPYIRVGKQISVPGGISAIPGYVVCGHAHE